MLDEMDEYRKKVERHLPDRRQLKNIRRRADYHPPKFWDLNMMIESLAIVGIFIWFLIFGLD